MMNGTSGLTVSKKGLAISQSLLRERALNTSTLLDSSASGHLSKRPATS